MKSMTGFGAAERVGDQGKIEVEARSYNSRFLDVKLRLSRSIQSFEPRLYQWAKDRFLRGRVEISIQWKEISDDPVDLQLNTGVLNFYLDLEKRLRNDFGLPGQLDISSLLNCRDLLSATDTPVDMEREWPHILKALQEAAEGLEEMQQQEGAAIKRDLSGRIDFLSEQLDSIKAAARGLPEKFRERLEERLDQLLSKGQCDPQRLAQEVVLYSDKIDITEEIVRLDSHLSLCKKSLAEEDMRGKRLEFLIQEIHREVNTIGSKSQNTDITYHVVDMKTELEKIREQSQNIQ